MNPNLMILIAAVLEIVARHRRDHGADPTAEQVAAAVEAEVAAGRADIAAWLASHPEAPHPPAPQA